MTTKFKIKRAIELLQSNTEVQLEVKMRGSEKAHSEIAEALLQLVLSQIVPKHARRILNPESDGSRIVCTIASVENSGNDGDTNL